MAASDHRVIAVMLDLKKKNALHSELGKREARADIVSLNVADPQSVKETVDYAVMNHGGVNVITQAPLSTVCLKT